jgi:hypothetical protein
MKYFRKLAVQNIVSSFVCFSEPELKDKIKEDRSYSTGRDQRGA